MIDDWDGLRAQIDVAKNLDKPPGRRFKKGFEWVCKPGSVPPMELTAVTIYLGRRLLDASRDLPGCR